MNGDTATEEEFAERYTSIINHAKAEAEKENQLKRGIDYEKVPRTRGDGDTFPDTFLDTHKFKPCPP